MIDYVALLRPKIFTTWPIKEKVGQLGALGPQVHDHCFLLKALLSSESPFTHSSCPTATSQGPWREGENVHVIVHFLAARLSEIPLLSSHGS